MAQDRRDSRVDWLLDFNPIGRQWISPEQDHLRADDLIIDGPSPSHLSEALVSRIPVNRTLKLSNGCLQRIDFSRLLVRFSFKYLSGAPFDVEGMTSLSWLEHELEISLDFIEAYARGLNKEYCFILEGRLYKNLMEGQVVGLDKITHSFHILYSPVSRKGLLRMEAVFKKN